MHKFTKDIANYFALPATTGIHVSLLKRYSLLKVVTAIVLKSRFSSLPCSIIFSRIFVDKSRDTRGICEALSSPTWPHLLSTL